jgi:hypothetical protein
LKATLSPAAPRRLVNLKRGTIGAPGVFIIKKKSKKHIAVSVITATTPGHANDTTPQPTNDPTPQRTNPAAWERTNAATTGRANVATQGRTNAATSPVSDDTNGTRPTRAHILAIQKNN